MEYGSGGGMTVTMDGPFAGGSGDSGVKLTGIYAAAADWKGGESPYSMAVVIGGVSVNSRVDVAITPSQMAYFDDQIISFMVVNNSGEITLYAFGDRPKADIELQASITEVMGEGVICGCIASTTVPRSDYSQTDPSKADYIRNKPDEAIRKAQSSADDAMDKAKAALPKSGGEMTGDINMGGFGITNLASPTEEGHAASKGYVDTRMRDAYLTAEVTLESDGWAGDGPYTQTVAVEGVLASDRVHYGVVYSGDKDTMVAQKEAFSLVDDLDSAEGSVTFTCFEEMPGMDLTIMLEVNR